MKYGIIGTGVVIAAFGVLTSVGSPVAQGVFTDYSALQNRQNLVKAETVNLQGKVEEQFSIIQEAMTARGIAIPQSVQGYCGTNIAPSQFCNNVHNIAQLEEEDRGIETALAKQKPLFDKIGYSGLILSSLSVLAGIGLIFLGRLRERNTQRGRGYKQSVPQS